MAVLFLELYQGDIPDALAGLPGANHYHQAPDTYWCALVATPPAGSVPAAMFAPFALTSHPNTQTHGTDTLDDGADDFVLSSLCIWHPKSPPYTFRVRLPDGTDVTLAPDTQSDDQKAWHCEPVAASSPPLGIYVVKVSVLPGTGSAFPESVDGSAARLNVALLPFSEQFFEKQPLLRVNGFVSDVTQLCPEIESVEVKGCAPGVVEFLIAFDQSTGIDQLTLTFGDGTTATITLAEAGGAVVVETLDVEGPGSLDASQIEITLGAAFSIKVTYEYESAQNLPAAYYNGSVSLIRTSCDSLSDIENFEVPICDGTAVPPCPNIVGPTHAVHGDTCVDGAWSVTFSATIANDGYGGELRLVDETTGAELDGAALNQVAQLGDDGALELTGSAELAPGTYSIWCENSCSSSSQQFVLDECPDTCPIITFLLTTYGTECVDGLRPVNIPVEIKNPPGHKATFAVELVDSTGEVLAGGSSFTGSLVLVGSKNYPEGTYTVTVNVLEPTGCEYADGENQLTFYVPACSDPDCPPVSIGEIDAQVASECSGGRRTVTLKSFVTVPPGVDGGVDATLSDGDGVLDSRAGATESFELSAQKDYEPGTHTITVEASAGDGCEYSRRRDIPVGPCFRPPWFPDWVPTPPDWLCLAWLIVNFLLLLVVGVAIGVAACLWAVAPVFWTALIIAVVAGILAIVSWALWALLCGWKPNVCPWARWLPRILGIIAFVFAAIVLVVAIVEAVLLAIGTVEVGSAGALASLPCFLGAVIEFAYFGFVGWILWETLLIVGCQPLPLISTPELPDPPD